MGRIGRLGEEYDTRYFLNDHLGSVRAIVNQDGVVTAEYDYMPYGMQHKNSSLATSDANEFRYNGKEFLSRFCVDLYDSQARLQGMNARFNSIDPLAGEMPDISPYAYCAGNPINRIDSDGKFWDTIWDVLNLVYDISAATYNHIKGDHEAAKGHWADAGADAAAAFIPFVPAGASKVVKVADKAVDVVKGADKTVDAVKTADKVGEVKKVVRNPHGSKGKIDHQSKVKELTEKAKTELQSGESILQEKKIQVEGSTRRPDVQIIGTDNRTRKVFEAERHPGSRRNKLREEEYRKLQLDQETHKLK